MKNVNGHGNIFDKAVALSIEFKRPVNRRKVATDQVQVEADEDFIHVSKDLLDSKEFNAICSHDAHVKGWLGGSTTQAGKCLRCPFIKRGVYMVPHAKVEEVSVGLEKFEAERKDLVATFIAAYPIRVEEAKEKLGGLFSASDYPPAEVVRNSFGMSWIYVDFNTPESLSSISTVIYEAEKQRQEKRLKNATHQIEMAMRASLSEIVSHVIERMSPKLDGTKKRFKHDTIDRVQTFLDDFKTLNITNDAELNKLVDSAKKAVEGIKVEDVRDDAIVRNNIVSKLSDVKTVLDQYMENAPIRKFLDE